MWVVLVVFVIGLLVFVLVVGCGGGVLSFDVVLVNGGELFNLLILIGINDSNGGCIIDWLFVGLMFYDVVGKLLLEVV